MCGIFGIVSKTRMSDDEFSRRLKKIEHRGPDGEGIQIWQKDDWHFHFGHRRLSILDLEGGKQPLNDPSQKNSIIFNGEIYNYEDLRRRLPHAPWKTSSDTEVALYHIATHGPTGLNDFDGFFGLAHWNDEKQKLILARDRWGIKPFFYRRLKDGGVAFASEIGPLLVEGSETLDLKGVEEYLFFDAVPTDSVVAGIQQLAPGEALIWNQGRIQVERYFRWESQVLKGFPPSEREASEVLWHEFKKAIRASFVSDVPVGILLSGGVDSTLVALAAAEEFGEGLPAFSVGFEEKSFDESGFAKVVANQIKADFHVKTLSPGLMLDRLDEILDRLDVPLADPSFLPTTLLCESAAAKVKVVVGGDAGDELFWGYPTYWAHGVSDRLRKIPGAVEFGSWVAQRTRIKPGYQSFGWKMKRLFGRWDNEPLMRHLRWMSGTDLEDIQALRGGSLDLSLRQDFARELKFAFEQDFSYPWLDLQFYLPHSVLTKVDRASMSCGLEVRPPMLSNDFAMWALRLPASMKLREKETKWILREALRKKVPASLVKRPKHGFAIPLFEWLQGPLKPRIEGILQDSPLWDQAGLSNSAAREMWQGFLRGERDLQKTFWALLVLDHWLRRNSSYLISGRQA